MCGIAGKLDFGRSVDSAAVVAMCDAMEHRGPDERGLYQGEGITLGMQRLAIIDVAHGHQPMFNEDRTLAVVLNGEIYNFRELHHRLVQRGHRLATHSDTEVLTHLYEDHGENMVDYLRGMFAIAIWDAKRRELFLARDRVGKKPLYWARSQDRVWFASEVYALLRDPEIDATVNSAAISAYLTLQYVPHPLSAFEGVHKLPPGSTLTISEDRERLRRYWKLDYRSKVDRRVTTRELAGQLRDLIDDATRARLISEVPLGAFLSGGLDSSAVVASMAQQMASPVKTFSIGFPDSDFDERNYARLVAERFATEHCEFTVEPDAVEILPKLVRHYGEPYADPSAIPSFYLAELTSRQVTVALNGDGGDEAFAGYSRYYAARLAGTLDWLPRSARAVAPRFASRIGQGPRDSSARSRLYRVMRAIGRDPATRYATWMSAFDAEDQKSLLQPEFLAHCRPSAAEDVIRAAWLKTDAEADLDRMLGVDVNTYLPDDLLVKMDIASMAYSLEARSPLLDHEVMEFAASLPAPLKRRGTQGKWLLKEAMRGVLPDVIIDRPKKGFAVPLARWFREDLRDLPGDLLLDRRSLDRGYFRREKVEALIAEHRGGDRDHALRLWVLVALEMWHREVVDKRAPVDALRT